MLKCDVPIAFVVAESTRYEGMTERASQQAAARTSLCLLAALVLSCATSDSNKVLVLAQPEPLAPGFVYGDNLADDPESLVSIATGYKNIYLAGKSILYEQPPIRFIRSTLYQI